MCGIAGFYEFKETRLAEEREKIARDMADALTHRGPDSGDTWLESDVPLALAHRRLSILDLSAQGAQPMVSASGRYVLSYNGEIYNAPTLRQDLEALGVSFQGRSDTEILLAAIEHWSLNQALQKINGMFAFALWDKSTRTLHLIRDRLGKKPLYVGWAEGALIFASELKSFHAHPAFTPALNKRAASLFMRHGAVPAPDCIYEGIYMLPPACRMALALPALQPDTDLKALMEPYWSAARAVEDARAHPLAPKNDEAAIDEFEALLSGCVADRMISDVPLGAFLSGGIDSSAIVALMQKHSPRPVNTYTIGFEEMGFDEAPYARQIAEHLGTNHHELYLSGKEARDLIPQLPQIYDEPFADISALPTLLLSRFARAGVSVALSGDGGDEMLGGYNRHLVGPSLAKRMKFIPCFVRQMVSGAIKTLPPERWDALKPEHPQFGTKLHKAAHLFALKSPEDLYEAMVSLWPAPPVLEEAKAQADLFTQADLAAPRGLGTAAQMMFRDSVFYLPSTILTKVDRASMATSLEVRAPLLDRRIYEHVWRLPDHYKIRNGQGKFLLRKLLNRYVPDHLFERPKQGFSIPVGQWLRADLRDWAEDLLDEHELRADGILDAQTIRKCWAEHLSGQGNHATALWAVLMFQSWTAKWL